MRYRGEMSSRFAPDFEKAQKALKGYPLEVVYEFLRSTKLFLFEIFLSLSSSFICCFLRLVVDRLSQFLVIARYAKCTIHISSTEAGSITEKDYRLFFTGTYLFFFRLQGVFDCITQMLKRPRDQLAPPRPYFSNFAPKTIALFILDLIQLRWLWHGL